MRNFFLLCIVSAFVVLQSAWLPFADDELLLTWGTINASSKKINMVKIADFEQNIAAPLQFKLKNKDIIGVSAHVNIFPIAAGIDPIQVDLINGELPTDAREVLKKNAQWGTKIFIENPEYTLKGKVKKMQTIGIKLN